LNLWIRNLSFARKLLLVGLVALVPSLIATGLFLAEQQRAINVGARELAGLHRYRNLETLLLPVGLHQIWSSALAPTTGASALSASASALAESAAGNLEAASAEVERVLSTQDAQNENYGAPAGEDARRWNEIKMTWTALRGNGNLSVAERERLYGDLRREIMAYRDYIADTSALTLENNPLNYFVLDAGVLQWSEFEGNLADMRSHAANVAIVSAGRASRSDLEQILHAQALAQAALERMASDFHRAAESGTAGDAWRVSMQGAFALLSSDFDAWSKYVKQNVLAGTNSDSLDTVLRNALQLMPAISAVRAPLEQSAEQQLQQQLSHLRAWRDGFLALLAATLASVLVTMSMVSAGSVNEMNQLVAVVSNLAEGDYARDITAQGSHEVSHMAAALGAMQDKLRDVLQGVKGSASTVAMAAREISAGTADLSVRTERQAANLEETASSMEHMTSTVRQNADNARLADTLAKAARDQAENGGMVVEQAVAAMGAIDVSSKQIADIISVIDEIAFQTNLLALNAAVEAARAGDQGRGFAVVAGEVRNLAQRSASAAKAIKALINDSVSKVGEGGRLVSESGRYLGEIVAAVKKVSVVVGEISNASQEQAAAAEQISRALTQMDHSTQQNAAMVEQANAAAASMSEQAVRLSELISFFKFKDGGPLHAAPESPMAAAAANRTASGMSAKSAMLARAERRSPSRPWTHPGAAATGAASAAPEGSALAPVNSNTDWSEF
jgi:methyl-accepting chemotaxis protein